MAGSTALVMLGDTSPQCKGDSVIGAEPVDDIQSHSTETSGELDRVFHKTSRVIVPMFCLCMIWNHIDRTNLAFAALSMNRDLGFDAATYGLGSALFFPTFCLFQVPSNLIMVRVGCRVWLSILLVSWGVVASCFSLIHDARSFFILRLLLGAFESGAVPAMWYHLTRFYPQERLVKPYSWLTMGILLANVLGAPLAAGFLAMDGIAGLHGWQWLFLLEGIPSVLLGVVMFCLLPNSPNEAKWLTQREKDLLEAEMSRCAVSSPVPAEPPRSPARLIVMALRNPLIPYMCVIGVMLNTAAYSYIFWLPIIVNALLSGQALTQVAAASVAGKATQLKPILLTSIPYTVGAITTWLVAHSSMRRRELYWHCSICLALAGIIFALFPVMAGASITAGFVSLVLTVGGSAAGNGPGVAILADVCKGPSQVVGMPLYNSISVVGGFIGPYVTGAIVQRSGGFQLVTVIMGSLLFGCGVLVAALKYIAAWRTARLDDDAASRVSGSSSDEERQQ